MYDEHGATDAHVDGNKVTDFNTAGEMGSPLKGKQRDGIPTSNKGPLRLLDLPLDILKEIVQKVGTALAFLQSPQIKKCIGLTHQ